jgi:hypothetical protein
VPVSGTSMAPEGGGGAVKHPAVNVNEGKPVGFFRRESISLCVVNEFPNGKRAFGGDRIPWESESARANEREPVKRGNKAMGRTRGA